MILADCAIAEAIEKKRIIVDPVPDIGQIAPSALDLRVGHDFLRWKKSKTGINLSFRLSEVKIPEYGDYCEPVLPDRDGLVTIHPGEFVLGNTLEYVSLPYKSKLAARIEGRSSYARLGLVVHMTAPTIHCGFVGTITLEMMNFGEHDLQIDPGKTCICQLIFEKLNCAPKGKLKTTFLGQSSILGDKKRK